MRRAGALLGLLCLAVPLGGCPAPRVQSESVRTDAGPQTLDMSNAAQVKAAVGKWVVIAGTARNAKLSAVVAGPGWVVYCLDHQSWPNDVEGTKITVQGTLEYTREFQAKTSPIGEISQGSEDGIFALRKTQTK